VTFVSDAGPLIHLSWIDQLELLPQLFQAVTMPPAVEAELYAATPGTRGLEAIRAAHQAGWLTVTALPTLPNAADIVVGLDRGEAEALILASALEVEGVLMDDRRGRRRSIELGIEVTGTVGILQMARDLGLIVAVTPLLEELRDGGFRLGLDLLDHVRREEA